MATARGSISSVGQGKAHAVQESLEAAVTRWRLGAATRVLAQHPEGGPRL